MLGIRNIAFFSKWNQTWRLNRVRSKSDSKLRRERRFEKPCGKRQWMTRFICKEIWRFDFRSSVPRVQSKMLTLLVNFEVWCAPPWRRPPSKHSLPARSHNTPPYDRLHDNIGSDVHERVSASYISKAFTGRLHCRPPTTFCKRQSMNHWKIIIQSSTPRK